MDDDASVLKSMQRLFSAASVVTVGFSDPESFLDYARANPVTLAILDVCMGGGLSGLDVQTRLRAVSPQTPVIIVTANNQPATEAEARANGAVRFFVKPFDSNALLAAAMKALEQARERSQDPPS
jgi:two-component system response regulator HydG